MYKVQQLASHLFTPVAIETSGAIGPKSLEFLKELGRRVRWHTKDERATFLPSIAIQQGNAASILGDSVDD